jgi:hypothetical protein
MKSEGVDPEKREGPQVRGRIRRTRRVGPGRVNPDSDYLAWSPRRVRTAKL